MSCLENIIGIKAQCDGSDTTSLSGYFVNDYPGITIQSAANYNDEKTITGFNYLVDLRRRAMLRLKNDVIAYVNSNFKVNSLVYNSWASGAYNQNVIAAGPAGQRRGKAIYKKQINCRYKKMVITKVTIYSNETITTNLQLADTAGAVYTTPIDLVNGEMTTVVINKTFEGNEVQVTIPSDISVYSITPACGGCPRTKSDCVDTVGISNSIANTTESFGIQLEVVCKCDLSSLVCDMATDNIIGQAAYELYGAMFYDEMIKNHRLNYLTIYKGDEIKQQAQAGFDAYNGYLANAMMGMRNYIMSNDGGCNCIDCSGAQIKSSV